MEEIKSLQKLVDDWIQNIGLRYFNELTNMAILTEEVGEVARIIARRYGEQSEKESDKTKDLGEELADVLFVTLCLANQTNTNLQEAFSQKLKIKTERDKLRHISNEKLYKSIPLCEMIDNEVIQISGSKSETNRLLILQKLYSGIDLHNISNSQDSQLLTRALDEKSEIIDIHHAGTAMRFLTSFFSIQEDREVILTGSSRMKQRPIKPLVDALQQLDADVSYVEKEGFPPLKIIGKKITKNKVKIKANISSQFITSLLLIGGKLENGLIINLEGKIASLPYLLMTMEILKKLGIGISLEDNVIKILPLPEIKPISFTIESDWSSASYFYSLAAIAKKRIILKSFNKKSLQADVRVIEIYKKYFGLETSLVGEDAILLSPIPDFIYPQKIILDMNNCPDIVQTVCVTATALKIPFDISGLETLKVKETDRLVALKNELYKIGMDTEISEDRIKSLKEVPLGDKIYINTYDDHRMVMAFAPFALVKSIEFEDPNVVEKSYPNFWRDYYKVVK